ncbi:MAG TPA: amidohydrolase [Thermoanaerobaculia bacterium]|nr:amidohydrolase [Thermoanaerobaculia bacterium]
MIRSVRPVLVVVLSLLSLPLAAHAQRSQPSAKASPNKLAAMASVDTHRAELVDLSDRIWRYAETALRETRSAKALADHAETQGFRVERGVAGMPTAFVASYGEGKPVIAILGEYDALPGISQKAQPTKEPLEAGAPGHGCGHNLFGAASLGAAMAVKELIAAGKLRGTIRFYGTPAEESVGGKLYMVREGLFRDVDIALAWHPDTEIRADTKSSQAMVDFVVEFRGRAAHAAFDPWNGRSALDAAELFTHGLNLMREHVQPSVRMHYVVLDGGDVPNVVPEHARIWAWVRDSKHASVDVLLERVRKIVQGAALAAEVEGELKVQSGDYEMLPNMAGAKLLQANLDWLGPLQFTPEEQELAKTIQRETGVEQKGLDGEVKPLDEHPGPPDGGSTDVADVSWNVPVIHLTVTTGAAGAPWHAWPVVACAGMSIGHKGLTYAAKALAATTVDLFESQGQRDAVRKEFAEKTKGQTYKGYIPAGPPPIPKD